MSLIRASVGATLLASLLALPDPASQAANPALVLDARIVWSEPWKRFGGFSGFEVTDDGARFVTVSDRAAWAEGDFIREDGRLTGAVSTGHGPLHAISGATLRDLEIDAEGLALDAEGRAYVSFEAFHRIRRYDRLDGPAAPVPSADAFVHLQNNSGLEALAIDADGVLYTIPERSGALDRPFRLHRFRDGAWDRKMRISREGSFLPVGADFGPDGRLYLLERDFAWLGGFATRIRRFRIEGNAAVEDGTLLETAFGDLDNMEGIAVWRDPTGATRITLIADDNFLAFQRTVIAEYLLVGD